MNRLRHTHRGIALPGLRACLVAILIAGYAGCLSLNPNYSANDAQAGPAEEGTQRVDEDDTENSKTSTNGLTTFSEPPGQSPSGGLTTSSAPPGETMTSASTDQVTPTGSIDWLTTSISSTQTGWGTQTTSSSGTSSSTSGGSPLRRGIEIRATDVSETLLAGYPLSLTFDHRAMVAQGAAIDGSDLSVISERGGSPVSRPRVLDRMSGWNRENTTIWFTIESSIAPGSTISDGYFLVTQHPSVTPNSRVDQVFLELEDFDDMSLNPSRWSTVESTEGSRSLTLTQSRAVLTASPHLTYPQSYITIRRAAQTLWPSVRIDAATRFTNTGLSGNCGRVFPLALTTNEDDRLRTGLRSDVSEYAALSSTDPGGANIVFSITGQTPRHNPADWDVHSLTWRGSEISYWRDGTQLITTQSQSSITRPNQRDMQLEFSVGAQRTGCTGSGELGLEVDWYRIRRYTFPEPLNVLK